MKFHGILSNLLRSVGNADFPYLSNPYLVVSWAIKIISLIQFWIIFSASLMISGIVLDCCFHLIAGMIQKVHLLSHHSAILRYSNFCSRLVYTLGPVLNSKSPKILLSYHFIMFFKFTLFKSPRER